jgi:hypothetical protein
MIMLFKKWFILLRFTKFLSNFACYFEVLCYENLRIPLLFNTSVASTSDVTVTVLVLLRAYRHDDNKLLEMSHHR